ncbi:MAG: hypothetical protein ABL888_13255 [Pirellulaceae bacterium]
MTVKKDILNDLETLKQTGQQYCTSFRGDGIGGVISNIDEHELRAFAAKSYVAIERIAGRTSEFYKLLPTDLNETLLGNSYGPALLSSIYGSLSALHDAVNSGHIETLESQIRAHVHDDFLQQSKDLLTSNYHVAAMVLVGGVLEDHLEKLCTKNALAWSGTGSISKYNDACRKGNIYDQAKWRRIQSIGDLRNQAAHGQGEFLNSSDVVDARLFTERFISDYPA